MLPRKRCNSKVAIWISCIVGIALLWTLVSLVLSAEKRITPKGEGGSNKDGGSGQSTGIVVSGEDSHPENQQQGHGEDVEASTTTSDPNNRGDEGDAEDIFLRANCDGEPLQPQISTLPTGKKIKPATIAYSLAIHHKFDHLMYWMDSMYEIQHFYMIHVDAKAPNEFWEQVNEWAEKFPNVKVNPNRYQVVYYGWTVLWTHIENFKQIIKMNETRDYFINMAGMDMPIKTRREINYFLGEHMGMSFLYEHCVWPAYRQWWGNWSWSELLHEVVQVNDNSRIKPPTIQLKWGQHYVILHRDVVEWMFKSVEVLHLLGWVVNTKSPDEMFYATMLYHSPFMKKNLVFTRNNFKYATWDTCCSGSVLTEGHPCVMGTCDMPKLRELNHMWATKIDSSVDAELVPVLSKELEERSTLEKKLGKIRRIALFPGQILDPPEIDIFEE